MKSNAKLKGYITLLSEKYERVISETMANMIIGALKDFPDSECEKAFNHVIKYGRFYKDLIPDLLAFLERKHDDKPALAWVMVDRAVRKIGPYDSVMFSDPVIHSVIESMGGWVAFQNCTEADWKWRRKDFESLYRVMAKQKDHPQYLPGETEVYNMCRGFTVDKPIAIGEHKISGGYLSLVSGV